jgi:hypothetical protein
MGSSLQPKIATTVDVRVVMPMACRVPSQDHFQKHINKNGNVVAVNACGGKGCRASHKNLMLGIIAKMAATYIAKERMSECNI